MRRAKLQKCPEIKIWENIRKRIIIRPRLVLSKLFADDKDTYYVVATAVGSGSNVLKKTKKLLSLSPVSLPNRMMMTMTMTKVRRDSSSALRQNFVGSCTWFLQLPFNKR